ncbi:hypothetical protein QBC33DRAFT_460102 [Phialemonium atrogriseum]|uniref:Dockerin type 1 n=1 Tax=Phialemonium atrogriseum TaxID=1093897 RepID=A0AAJ0BU94_9PEZI|nr:uncharacterized protein QBC33DRAFT_460102 [Phialemonium atrogriseum]KAK1763162.1 hypothetical protein QBC33DRAFT_460102 [Phialemonium atrogriseum]
MVLAEPTVTVLGPDPSHRAFVLNGNAFQQDAITSFAGWQYAAFYSYLSPDAPTEPLYVHLARRKLPLGAWQVLVFDDYKQIVDDGHNTVQIGVCPGDGTIHLSYDHHCDTLRYRYSAAKGLAKHPERFEWKPDLFTPTLDHLPGLPSTHEHFGYVTYPRFGPMGDDLFCSFRDGKAGLGDDHLYLYSAAAGRFRYVGAHLTGVRSNPYVHGMDWRDGRLHVTWVYRGFVAYDGWDDPLDTKHKRQAGPNGAENNHDICYAYSDDKGSSWRNGRGEVVASLEAGGTVRNDCEGIVAVEIPKGRGLTNQESQAVDPEGGVHVLNRDDLDGELVWKHYYRSPEGQWSQRPIGSVKPTKRGRLAISRDGDLFAVLPDPSTAEMYIVRATKASNYSVQEEVWVGRGLSGEPLVDVQRLEHDNVLSLFVRADVEGAAEKKNVVVMDFAL